MGLGQGPGKHYWVHLIKHKFGNLNECIDYMKANPPKNNKQWYELRPQVKVKEGICSEYCCDLVEMAK